MKEKGREEEKRSGEREKFVSVINIDIKDNQPITTEVKEQWRGEGGGGRKPEGNHSPAQHKTGLAKFSFV